VGHAWLVTRHADIRAVLDDERFSRSACYAPGAPHSKDFSKRRLG